MDVDFFVDPVLDQAATRQAGRPIYLDVERVRISTVQGAVIVKNVDADVVGRWPEEFKRFQAQRRRAGDDQAGVPLEDWAVPSPARVRGLHERGISTVDQVAALDDGALAELDDDDMVLLRTRARAFLDGAAHEALLTRLSAENDELRRRVAALEARNRGLAQTIEGMELRGLPPDRPGQGMIPPAGASWGARPHGEALPVPVSALDRVAEMPLFASPRRTASPPATTAFPVGVEPAAGLATAAESIGDVVAAAESIPVSGHDVAELAVTE